RDKLVTGVQTCALPIYHLPHHLYASIPHYNLKELHDILMQYPEYREQALVVANVVLPKQGHEYPTVVDMLGPDYAPAMRHAAHRSEEHTSELQSLAYLV